MGTAHFRVSATGGDCECCDRLGVCIRPRRGRRILEVIPQSQRRESARPIRHQAIRTRDRQRVRTIGHAARAIQEKCKPIEGPSGGHANPSTGVSVRTPWRVDGQCCHSRHGGRLSPQMMVLTLRSMTNCTMAGFISKKTSSVGSDEPTQMPWTRSPFCCQCIRSGTARPKTRSSTHSSF